MANILQKETEAANKTLIDFFNKIEKNLLYNYEEFDLLYKTVTNTILQVLNNKLLSLTIQTDESDSLAHIQTLRVAYEKIYKTIDKFKVKK